MGTPITIAISSEFFNEKSLSTVKLFIIILSGNELFTDVKNPLAFLMFILDINISLKSPDNLIP